MFFANRLLSPGQHERAANVANRREPASHRWGAWAPFGLGVGALAVLASFGIVSCGLAPTPSPVNGPGGVGNVPPTLTITEPTGDITVGQGIPFLIRWADSDPDNNASVSFDLVSTQSSTVVPLVAGLAENDQVGPDSHTAGTALIPVGVYNLRGTIDDTVNPPVAVFATAGGAAAQRIVVRVVPEGTVGSTVPPRLTVTEPAFDRSVTQDDVLNVTIAPPFANQPFDQDSDALVYIVFDVDQDPNNDDPANPIPSQIIRVASGNITAGATAPLTFPITIDLSEVPPLPEGAPYFIRATADDGTNPRVHQYAVGSIHVTTLAAGLVDLAEIGRRISGSRWYGFNPGANLGSKVTGVGDFDADGTQDFVIVAQYGNPRNAGLLGEAYLVYGQPQVRFGGTISINSVAESVSGVIFEGPPRRTGVGVAGVPRTDGITDVSALPDFTADGRPELMFGLAHVHGAFDTMDFDPDDQDLGAGAGNIDIEVVLSQGEVTVQTGDDDPDVTSTIYTVDDTTISSGAPGTPLGSDPSLAWQDAGDAARQWTLIKFADVLDELPDPPFFIDITTVEADLRLRVFDTGGQSNVHQSITDFDEQTTYNTYAGGADPVGGDNFFLEPQGANGALGQADGGDVGFETIDVTPLVQRLLDGQLIEFDNELRFILVPGTTQDDEDEAQVRSSEFSNPDDRPRLTIQYERIAVGGGLGCYPDLLVNNRSDAAGADRNEFQWYGGGMAIIVNSTNRDSDGLINPDRLEATSVALELVGQRPFSLDATGFNQAGGGISVRADNSAAGDAIGSDEEEGGRIAGARVIAGPYDWEDHLVLRQPARDDLFGQSVGFMGDVDNDGLGEIIISAPTNERHLEDLRNTFGLASTHIESTSFRGSIVVLPGTNYNDPSRREIDDDAGTCTTPPIDHFRFPPFGSCSPPFSERGLVPPASTFQVFAETLDDRLGGAGSAGDFNQDGLDDIVCGAYRNDRPGVLDSGAVYVLYSRNVLSDFHLDDADDPIRRSPMLRIRGLRRGDQLGWRQTSGRDVNGDRIEDVFFSSPRTDFGGVTRTTCGVDFDGDRVFDQDDLSLPTFNACRSQLCDASRPESCDLFRKDACKAFDYDNDNDIDDDDRCVFCCLSDDCDPDSGCVHGRNAAACCENLVDNGFAAVVFGGRFVDGDRSISQIATSDLPGVVFYGGTPLDRAGVDISSAGDFNQDGFGDILISAPGEVRRDSAGRARVGVIYLVFGGTHLNNTVWDLSDPDRGVGSVELPGIIFFSPYVEGRPNEAAPLSVALLGDINNDGFDDIAIGNPKADFIDLSFPQGPDAPGSDAAAGRRRDAGDVYVIYGSNFGSNRGAP